MMNEDQVEAVFKRMGNAGLAAMCAVGDADAPNATDGEKAKMIACAAIGITMASFAAIGMNRADTLSKVYEIAGQMTGDLFNADGRAKL